MIEIIPGIHQLKIPIPNNPLEYTNTYLLQGDDGYFLIDAGWGDEMAFQALKKQLSEIGVDLKDISQIIITHAHRDHYGLADRLRQLSQAKVSLHHLEKNIIAPRYQNIDEVIHQLDQWFHANGVPADELPTSQAAFAGMSRPPVMALPDISLTGTETISTGIFNLQVLWTPGHSPGHICLYESKQKILLAGDHVLPVVTPNVSLQPNSKTNPLGDFINSLAKVKELDVNLVLPAHEKVFNNLQRRVDEIIQHHEQRSSEMLETMKDGPKTAYQVSTAIIWMPEFGGVRFQNLAPWDKRMAVAETLAHLEAMRVGGRVTKFSRDSIIYYQRE